MGQARFTLYVFGRLHGLTRARLEHLVTLAGGRVLRRPSAAATLVAVAHGTAHIALDNGVPATLPLGVSPQAEVISEASLRRLLGLDTAPPCEVRIFDDAAISAATDLEAAVIEALVLYDVLDGVDGLFAYRDLVAARQVKRLLCDGVELADVIAAAAALRRGGKSLADTRVAEGASGELVQSIGGTHGQLDGQLLLGLSPSGEWVDEVFERAEACEAEGDLPEAERWYRVALQMSRTDPVIPFNLGNVLDAAGRQQEAVLAYGQALSRDPSFAEAWVNIGTIRERQDWPSEARRAYERALSVRPDCAEALYNLGLMLTWNEEYAEALPFWEKFTALGVSTKDTAQARRLIQLCQLGTHIAA